MEFVKGFIFNLIFIGLDGSFVFWVGVLIKDLMQFILIVVLEGREEEMIKRLVRVGYDNVIGYFEGGFEVWKVFEVEYDVIEIIDFNILVIVYEQNLDINVMDV